MAYGEKKIPFFPKKTDLWISRYKNSHQLTKQIVDHSQASIIPVCIGLGEKPSALVSD